MSDICAARHRHSPESVDANAGVEKIRDQATVLYLVRAAGPRGRTSKEIAREMGRGLNCISGRLTELKVSGAVVRTDERRDGAAVLVAEEFVRREVRADDRGQLLLM